MVEPGSETGGGERKDGGMERQKRQLLFLRQREILLLEDITSYSSSSLSLNFSGDWRSLAIISPSSIGK